MIKKRKNYTPEEKVAILKRHLAEGVPVSDLCDQFGLHPTVYYRWQKEFFENGANAFLTDRDPGRTKLERRITELEQKLAKKHEVLSELLEEHISLKKRLGELSVRPGCIMISVTPSLILCGTGPAGLKFLNPAFLAGCVSRQASSTIGSSDTAG
mgnify:CR=1 FL=1